MTAIIILPSLNKNDFSLLGKVTFNRVFLVTLVSKDASQSSCPTPLMTLHLNRRLEF